MKFNKIVLATTLLLASICQAQYLEVSKAKVIYEKVEVTTVRVIDESDEVLKTFKIESDPKPTIEKELTVVKATTSKEPKFYFTNEKREDVSSNWTELDKKTWATNIAGKYWVEIDSPAYGILDPETNEVKIFDEDEEIVLEVVGLEPDPVDPDNPLPEDEFDNISQRVSEASKGLDRNVELAEFFNKIANDMETFKILRAKDARTTINEEFKKYPNYTAVLKVLSEDASTRLLGWTQTCEYYKAIARGLGE